MHFFVAILRCHHNIQIRNYNNLIIITRHHHLAQSLHCSLYLMCSRIESIPQQHSPHIQQVAELEQAESSQASNKTQTTWFAILDKVIGSEPFRIERFLILPIALSIRVHVCMDAILCSSSTSSASNWAHPSIKGGLLRNAPTTLNCS